MKQFLNGQPRRGFDQEIQELEDEKEALRREL